MDKEHIAKALEAFNDRLRYYEHYTKHQISGQESMCRIAQVLKPDVLEVIVSALERELKE